MSQNPKGHVISFRVDDQAAEAIEALVKATGRSRGDLAREMVLDGISSAQEESHEEPK